MNNRGRDLFKLEHILESAKKIEEIISILGSFENFQEKWLEQDAMIRSFEVIGEATKNISHFTTEKHPEVAWHKMRGLRNIIVHEYFGVRMEVI